MTLPSTEFVFLSYARVDKTVAASVANALEAAGIPVWWDIELTLGDRWQPELEDRLDHCSAFVVLIGEDGVTGWVEPEVGVALDRHYSRLQADGQSGKTPSTGSQQHAASSINQHHRLPIVPILVGNTPASAVPSFLSHFQWFELSLPPEADAIRFATQLRDSVFKGYRAIEMPEDGPYPGLAPYNASLQQFFFGRQQAVYDVMRLWNEPLNGKRRRWLSIEGNSGMGKSSLMRAGVLPAVREQWLKADNIQVRYHVLDVMHPGKDPVAALSRVLAPHCNNNPAELRCQMQAADFRISDLQLFADQLPSGSQRIPVLPVDQFEELFTQAETDMAERFARLLAQAISDNDSPLYLITTIRDDFLGHYSDDNVSALAAARNESARYALGRIDKPGLEDIVKRPIELAGLGWSHSDLPVDIVNDVVNEPGALLLVNNLMRDLYTNRDTHKQQILRTRYQTLGGTAGALKESADKLIDSLGNKTRQKAAWNILIALVQSPDGITHTKRSISRERAWQSSGLDNFSADAVLSRLSGSTHQKEDVPARLITIDAAQQDGNRTSAGSDADQSTEPNSDQNDDQIELMHESLVRLRKDGETPYWPALYNKIQHENFLSERHRLEQDAQIWQRMKIAEDTNASNKLVRSNAELRSFQRFERGADVITHQYLAESRKSLQSQQRKSLGFGAIGLTVIFSLLAFAVYFGKQGLDGIARDIDQTQDRISVWWKFRKEPDQYIPELTLVEVDNIAPLRANSNVARLKRRTANFDAKPDFEMTVTEVTNNQYKAYLVNKSPQSKLKEAFSQLSVNVPDDAISRQWPQDTSIKGSNLPVIRVNWYEAMAYSVWLGERLGKNCRLPTEAEWVYAATGGKDIEWPWGDQASDADTYAWYDSNSNNELQPVRTREPTSFGLHDIAGNAREWTADCYDTDSEGSSCSRVLRGGAFNFDHDFLRASDRYRFHPDYRVNFIGFRVLCRPH